MKETKFKQTLVQTKDERRKTKEGTRHCEERSDVAIQSGFKMTEVGLIPNDWNLVEISELAKDMADGPFGSNLKKEHYTSDPQVRIIQLSNIGECGWENENTKYTTFEHAKTIARCIVPKEESILVAKMMPAGRAIICPKTEKQYILGSDVIRITANEKLNSKYFVYATKSQTYLKQISDNTQGSTRQRTSISKLRKIAMPLPILKEQQRIANALSDVDTLIANLEKLIVKKKNIKQGAMQQLLTGKKRLPGFGSDERTGSRPTDERRKECHSERSAKREVEESSGYKMTELGLIPSDWEVKTFGELFDMCTANIPIKDVNQEFYVGTENMLQNKMGVVKNTAVLPYSKVREYQKNDILVSNIRPYLKKIWFADKNGGCSTDVLVFRVKDKNQSPSFLYNVVADDRFFNIVNENAIGTKMPRGDKNVIKQILFAVPSSKAEQTAIANVLSDMDTEISALETKLAKYRTLKTGMMQQLLTGII